MHTNIFGSEDWALKCFYRLIVLAKKEGWRVLVMDFKANVVTVYP